MQQWIWRRSYFVVGVRVRLGRSEPGLYLVRNVVMESKQDKHTVRREESIYAPRLLLAIQIWSALSIRGVITRYMIVTMFCREAASTVPKAVWSRRRPSLQLRDRYSRVETGDKLLSNHPMNDGRHLVGCCTLGVQAALLRSSALKLAILVVLFSLYER